MAFLALFTHQYCRRIEHGSRHRGSNHFRAMKAQNHMPIIYLREWKVLWPYLPSVKSRMH